jgi:hypothetical protein
MSQYINLQGGSRRPNPFSNNNRRRLNNTNSENSNSDEEFVNNSFLNPSTPPQVQNSILPQVLPPPLVLPPAQVQNSNPSTPTNQAIIRSNIPPGLLRSPRYNFPEINENVDEIEVLAQQTTSRSLFPHSPEPIPEPIPEITCIGEFAAYINLQIKKKITQRSYSSFIINDSPESKISILDRILIDERSISSFVEGNFRINSGSATDAGGPYRQFTSELADEFTSLFKIKDRKLQLNISNSQLPSNNNLIIFYITQFLMTKPANIKSVVKFGHIVKSLIENQFTFANAKRFNIDESKTFADIIVSYVKFCSRSSRVLTDEEITEFLQNNKCFSAVLFCFVKYIETNFNPALKLDHDYIDCFSSSNPPAFLFVEDIDWSEYDCDDLVKQLIKDLNASNNLFKIYSGLYYDQSFIPADFINKLKFIGFVNDNLPFPLELKNKIIRIFTNYEECLNSKILDRVEQKLVLDIKKSIGSQEDFIRKFLKYSSGTDILQDVEYIFQLTSVQPDIFFVHTCFQTVDIVQTAELKSLFDLTVDFVSRIEANVFNVAG